MKSHYLKRALIFLTCAWIFGASLSCPDNITHKSIKNSNDQSRLTRLKLEIPNDNNLAREISRSNKLAPGVSITENNREVSRDKSAEQAQLPVNDAMHGVHYKTYFPNYFTEHETKLKQDLFRTLHNRINPKINENVGIVSPSNLKSKQMVTKSMRRINVSGIDAQNGGIYDTANAAERKTHMRNNNTSSYFIKRIITGQTINKHFSKHKKQEKPFKTQHIYVENPHNIERREAIRNYSELDSNNPYMQEVKIATVLPGDDWHPFNIKRVQPAIELAIDKMNPIIAHHNRTLTVRFRDSKCDIADGINECINFYVNKEMHVLFGPCCDYTVAPCARQVRYWDVPMITAGGLAGDFGLGKHSMYSTMTRVGSNFNTLVQFFVDVLLYYNWRKLKLVYDPYGQTDISSKLCHIAANDIHYGLREIHHSKNITQTYVKFEYPEKIPSKFGQQFGVECSDEMNGYKNEVAHAQCTCISL